MSDPQRGRIFALDGLRAVAAALVAAGHGVDASWTPITPFFLSSKSLDTL